MAFFLLGRSEDGSLSLLSNATFESRQDALAELGQITGDASFDRWADDVLLIDLDSATPVLLVRPAEAPGTVEPVAPEPTTEPEAAVFAAMADEPADHSDTETVGDDGDRGGSEVPEIQELPESELDESEAEQADDEVEAPAEEAVEPFGVAEEPVDEAESPDESTDAESESAETDIDSLRDAIARTTEHMEAAGIVAPESIGPAAVDTVEELPSDDASPADPEAPEASDATSAEPATWPWATASAVTPLAEAADSDTLEADVSFVLDGLEEPAVDAGGSLITSSIDDEALAANRPVILGAYDETPQVKPEAEPEAAADSVAADDDAVEVTDESPEPAEDSDFIVLDDAPRLAEETVDSAHGGAEKPDVGDLDAIEPAVAASVDAGADEGDDVLALSSYVCDDCVYVETCPNKDQRRPEDCGSFQWK